MAKSKIKPFVTTVEAAEMAGVKPSTLRGLVSMGQAPKPLHPGSGLYDRAEIVAWIKARPGHGYRTDLRGRAW